MSDILPPKESWEITNISSLNPLPWADIPALDGVIRPGKTIEALDYTTADILGASDVYRNYITRYPPKISSPGYRHTHDDKADVVHTHSGLDILTGGPTSDADALHTHVGLGGLETGEYVIPSDLDDYVRKDGSINQLSDINSSGASIENAVAKAHDETHTILEHVDGDDPFTMAHFRKLLDGSNADCCHVHSDAALHGEHNDLDGLNEGDYIHLTAAEYANLGSGILTGNHNDLDGLQGGSAANPSWPDEYYHLIYDEYCTLTNEENADSLHFHNATAIVYNNVTYPTVDDALDSLLYVTPNILTFTNNVGSIEIGSTVNSTTVTWTLDESANLTSQIISPPAGIGEVGTVVRNYIHVDSYTTNRTYTLTITDGVNPDNASTTIYFRHKRYWGTSALTSLNDAQVIALSSELSTSRSMSKTIVSAAAYIYFAWPASWDASPPATFTVNGLNNTAWTYVTRAFINASGHSESFRIYRSDNLLTGSYDIVVS